MIQAIKNTLLVQQEAHAGRRTYGRVFLFFLALSLAIYFPAYDAGFVGDVPYCFADMERYSLWQYMNPAKAGVMYQLAHAWMYICHWLFGVHPLPWHLLYCALHALNGWLIFRFFDTLLHDAKVTDAALAAFAGALLFLVAPGASEPVVWEAAGHFLHATTIIFVILNLVLSYYHTGKKGNAAVVAILYFLSSFSLEYFYLTPFFVLLLTIYYYLAVNRDRTMFTRVIVLFVLPLFLLLAVHFVLLKVVVHTFFSHYGEVDVKPIWYYLGQSLKYMYHVLFLGRFHSGETRRLIYGYCESKAAIAAIYGLLSALWLFVLFFLRKASARIRVVALVCGCAVLAYLFISPLIFADSWLIGLDRYTYLAAAFTLPLMALLISGSRFKWVGVLLLLGYGLYNLWGTRKEACLWQQSASVINNLLDSFPEQQGKRTLLLNLPYCLKGAHMISAEPDGRFMIMRQSLSGKPVTATIYDVMAYNMDTKDDGAHVRVLNDSTVNVTLNQWGTWWLYSMLGGHDYENEDYKVIMKDPGHQYDLMLKRPADSLLLLYQVGDQWHTVDWTKKDVEQN